MSSLLFKIGQRWISNAEPELGMGQVTHVDQRLVSLRFDTSEEDRTYSRQHAPLTRVKFAPGDMIKAQDFQSLLVDSVTEREGILIYHGNHEGISTAIAETDLDPDVRFSKPQDRLFTHQVDENKWFDLRYHTLNHIALQAESRYQGLFGARVSLIPHQLHIANEVANRFSPRVLLADEVGLGKTIEAGLIIHKQLLTGRSKRVLIIVPPALTFQWFVELARRFSLQFVILSEERCLQIENDNKEEPEKEGDSSFYNPFDAQQLMLCHLDLFLHNSERLSQVLEADLDLVVVDEAHHLLWTPQKSSPEYDIIDEISRKTKGLLLLTATPEQLGREGHFARLRLLDPARFHDLEVFIHEENSYEPVARIASQLVKSIQSSESNESIESDADLDMTEIESFLDVKPGQYDAKLLLPMLLDRHGTGRILFRNVRSSIAGFPQRKPLLVPLQTPAQYKQCENPFFPETGFYSGKAHNWTQFDPRVNWLQELTRSLNQEKILVICAHRETAVQLESFFSSKTTIRTTAFHEGLDLIARDRAAAYFAETEKGAQMMICSEIGSEGRNFQFSHHLALFDVPLSPDLIEQRIGRLDRIGQTKDVKIHIPYFSNTPQENLVRIYHEGMNIFSAPNPAAQSLFEEVLDHFAIDQIDELVEETKQLNSKRKDELNKGRDRLLELHSNDPVKAGSIVEHINAIDKDNRLELYMERNFEAWGLESEYLGEDAHLLKPTEAMIRHGSVSVETQDRYHYPEIPDEGIRYTYSRSVALAREDLMFLSWEAPLVNQALDLVATDFAGNSALIVIKHPQWKPGTLLLETLHLVEAISPARWNLSRYLPPVVIRSLIEPGAKDLSDVFPYRSFEEHKIDFPKETISQIIDSQKKLLQSLIQIAEESARSRLADITAIASKEMNSDLGNELDRLIELQKINPSVRDEEIQLLRDRKANLENAIEAADMRLDAVRVIIVTQ